MNLRYHTYLTPTELQIYRTSVQCKTKHTNSVDGDIVKLMRIKLRVRKDSVVNQILALSLYSYIISLCPPCLYRW